MKYVKKKLMGREHNKSSATASGGKQKPQDGGHESKLIGRPVSGKSSGRHKPIPVAVPKPPETWSRNVPEVIVTPAPDSPSSPGLVPDSNSKILSVSQTVTTPSTPLSPSRAVAVPTSLPLLLQPPNPETSHGGVKSVLAPLSFQNSSYSVRSSSATQTTPSLELLQLPGKLPAELRRSLECLARHGCLDVQTGVHDMTKCQNGASHASVSQEQAQALEDALVFLKKLTEHACKYNLKYSRSMELKTTNGCEQIFEMVP